jgi:hypothetical protein
VIARRVAAAIFVIGESADGAHLRRHHNGHNFVRSGLSTVIYPE